MTVLKCPLGRRPLIWIKISLRGEHPDQAEDRLSAQGQSQGSEMRDVTAGALILLSLTAPAASEDKLIVDLSKMTCRELVKLDIQDFAGITMWLSGYYNAGIRNTTIDLYQFARAAKTLKDYCQTSPQATVMSATERALGIKIRQTR